MRQLLLFFTKKLLTLHPKLKHTESEEKKMFLGAVKNGFQKVSFVHSLRHNLCSCSKDIFFGTKIVVTKSK